MPKKPIGQGQALSLLHLIVSVYPCPASGGVNEIILKNFKDVFKREPGKYV